MRYSKESGAGGVCMSAEYVCEPLFEYFKYASFHEVIPERYMKRVISLSFLIESNPSRPKRHTDMQAHMHTYTPFLHTGPSIHPSRPFKGGIQSFAITMGRLINKHQCLF